MKEIQLSSGHITLVDDEDYLLLMQWKWQGYKNRADKHRESFYAARTAWCKVRRRYGRMSLARHLMGATKGFVVDHIDGNPLNNQRKNLRLCTQSQNIKNQRIAHNSTTGFKGVTMRTDRRKLRFYCQIGVDNRRIFLGYFETAEEAARAYNAAAKKYHGEFARLNVV